jgi:TctA family transporter
MAANQRLLFFPIAYQVGGALLALPITLASHDTVTFDVYARDAADGDSRVVDLIRASSTSTTTLVVIVVAFIAAVLLQAWLSGAFIRSIGDGALRWWPGRTAFALLTVLYLVTSLVFLGLTAVTDSVDPLVALAGLLAFAVPVMFADYAIVLEDAPLAHAIVRSARLWRRRASQAMLVFVMSIIVGQLVFSLFVDKLDDSDGVFPGFFGALLLVSALFAYASDCLLIALLLENPDEEPVTARESESPE